MKLREQWTLLRPAAPVRDALTNNEMPGGPPQETPWTGLLQQRLLVSQEGDEIASGHVVSQLTLLLDPGIPGGVARRDLLRFDGPEQVSDLVAVGDTVQVQGTPRVRRPARGSRRAAYIAATVRHSTDLKE